MAVKTYKETDKSMLSANFAANEFACKGSGCCTEFEVDEKLVEILQQIRDHFGKPVTINSGYRCPKHNNKIGGAAGSKHMFGMAADIVVHATAPEEVAKYAESIGVLGIGLYPDFVHVDTRTKKSFWYGHGEEPRTTFGGAPVEKPVECVNLSLPMLQKGSKGATVKALQILLIGNGYGCGKYGSDGDFGANTDTAVRNFQRKHGLSIDGICGIQTWSKLLGL